MKIGQIQRNKIFKITLKFVKELLEEVRFNVEALENTSGFQTCFESDEC